MQRIEIIGDNYFNKYNYIREACRAVVLNGDNILLSYETKKDIWMLPGGGKEVGETDEECVIREVGEETGNLFKPLKCVLQLDEYYEDTRYVSKYFIGTITGTTNTHLTEEEMNSGLESRWISIEKALEIFSKHKEITDFEEKRGLYKREYLALKEILPNPKIQKVEAEEMFRNSNKNQDFTLIARDCIGGILYHQLGLRFLSPTINLFFVPKDFNRFCLHLEDYISSELVKLADSGADYPVGLLTPKKSSLKPVRVDFMHYESFEDAKNKWDERKTRINWDNIFVVSSFCYPVEVATLTPKLIEDWNKIKYKKIVLVDKKYGFNDEFIIKKPEECKEYAWLLFQPNEKESWKRTFNEFDFISFLNNK